MTSTDNTQTVPALSGERADLRESLREARHFLRFTVRELTDEQAATSPTVSALCLGGLIKHLAEGERKWVDFILEGPTAMASGGKSWADWDETDYARYAETFRMQPGESLTGLLAEYEQVARRTDELLATLDLDATQPLPEAPWFEPGVRWSARRVLMHIVAETAQHAGHADIIRETIDGARSMG
jgi:hypothetical protein